ncbi:MULTISPECIES: YitT family protein [Parachlamydia]|jgi:uncharacterized membrane-anchored protein YitT (DUF2179 family)|uniref:UPF0750 membrane protein yqfU n=2 Tax=Parachlamydia acanthamoebae TaxID=83552 RepID=F8L0X7_PARAV|nr:YitT family protein [Parachlamydia acanthamoebae]CCB86888.1 UPF0750 membrane protein yqfU [Parachlamydia acanthamoebae UV-7]
MKDSTVTSSKPLSSYILDYVFMAIGAFLAAFSISVFLIPSNLIDGGIVGVAMIFGYMFKQSLFPLFLFIFNLPFLYLAYKHIGKVFLIHMLYAVILFMGCVVFIESVLHVEFHGDSVEVVVIGGAILGIGLGLIIRYGGCLDGTEILGLIINKKTGFTVGQVVLVCNIFIFGGAGIAFQDWHPPLLSLITFMVASKVMDSVIVGLDETKSMLIISKHSNAIAQAIIHELGLGLTIMYGRGGYSGDAREILYVIVERLQLAELKELIYREDPSAFIAIENLHEVANGNQGSKTDRSQKWIESIMSRAFGSKKNSNDS